LDRLLHPRNVGWWLSPIDSPKIMEWKSAGMTWHSQLNGESESIHVPNHQQEQLDSENHRTVEQSTPLGHQIGGTLVGKPWQTDMQIFEAGTLFLKSTSNDNFWMHWTNGKYITYEYIWHFHIIAYFRAFKCLRIVKRFWIKNCFELAKEHIRDLFGQGVGNVLTLAGCVSIQNLIEQRAKHLTQFQGAEQGHHGWRDFQWVNPLCMVNICLIYG
jgi:hypothetical protein